MRHILVDGYNVIRADTRLSALERSSMESAREVLARTLGSSPRLTQDSVIVVFDGREGTRGHVHMQRMGRVTVLYSARGQSADEVIIGEAARLSHGARVIVVSNDVEVRERCRAFGCEVSGSENLLEQMPGAGTRRASPAEDDDLQPTISTIKRGNPRRLPKKSRRPRDVRF